MTFVPVKTDSPLMDAIKEAIQGDNENARYAQRVLGEAGTPIKVSWANKTNLATATTDGKYAVKELQATAKKAQTLVQRINSILPIGDQQGENEQNLWVAMRMASVVAGAINMLLGDLVGAVEPATLGNYESANAARLIERLDRMLAKLR